MIKSFKQAVTTTSVIIALTLTGCTRYETRMQANGPFDYQEAQLTSIYQTGSFSNDEARGQFTIPALSAEQEAGFLSQDVDIRPPNQFIAVIEGVLLELDEKRHTKVWFNTFKQNEDISARVWQLLESYLSANKIEIKSKDESLLQIETATFTQEKDIGELFNSNGLSQTSSYRFNLGKQEDGNSVALNVELLTYAESSDDRVFKFNFAGKSKKNVELAFVNDLLAYAYEIQQSNALNEMDAQPLAIKLGFDDNHQIAWLVDSEFLTTWEKLPDLFSLLSFELVESDKNLGYFLLQFTTPDEEYWAQNKLNPFVLENAEYFVQLGESVGGDTSILWLDEDKKPLPDQRVTDIYLSITEQVRNVLLLKDKQTEAL